MGLIGENLSEVRRAHFSDKETCWAGLCSGFSRCARWYDIFAFAERFILSYGEKLVLVWHQQAFTQLLPIALTHNLHDRSWLVQNPLLLIYHFILIGLILVMVVKCSAWSRVVVSEGSWDRSILVVFISAIAKLLLSTSLTATIVYPTRAQSIDSPSRILIRIYFHCRWFKQLWLLLLLLLYPAYICIEKRSFGCRALLAHDKRIGKVVLQSCLLLLLVMIIGLWLFG